MLSVARTGDLTASTAQLERDMRAANRDLGRDSPDRQHCPARRALAERRLAVESGHGGRLGVGQAVPGASRSPSTSRPARARGVAESGDAAHTVRARGPAHLRNP